MKLRECFIRDGVGVVPLSKGFEALVDVADLEMVGKHNWSLQMKRAGAAYAQRGYVIGGRPIQMLLHRYIMDAPKGMCVDHINGDGLDNRRANLRLCTNSENRRNQIIARRSKLGLIGVNVLKADFSAEIRCGGVKYHLGRYKTAEEAAAAYRGAAKVLYGEFAPDR